MPTPVWDATMLSIPQAMFAISSRRKLTLFEGRTLEHMADGGTR
jgi:hypothetical protein